ncbi:MAG: thiaminase II [Cardiobacteriaceae bacterium]|nr:thiaminase II [Cardiobacteriaceae bacterium]
MNSKTTSSKLHNAAKDIWQQYHSHPFIQNITDGTLEQNKFAAYLVQDYLYLYEYMKVYALGIAKADNEETMRLFSDSIYFMLNSEMNIHRKYMQQFGISNEQALKTSMSVNNRSYTSYMLHCAYQYGVKEILAAILSCAWSYSEIAAQIVKNNPKAKEHKLFGKWVSDYSSDDYAANNQDLINFFDKLTAKSTPQEYERYEEIFLRCSEYELDFWNYAWEVGNKKSNQESLWKIMRKNKKSEDDATASDSNNSKPAIKEAAKTATTEPKPIVKEEVIAEPKKVATDEMVEKISAQDNVEIVEDKPQKSEENKPQEAKKQSARPAIKETNAAENNQEDDNYQGTTPKSMISNARQRAMEASSKSATNSDNSRPMSDARRRAMEAANRAATETPEKNAVPMSEARKRALEQASKAAAKDDDKK